MYRRRFFAALALGCAMALATVGAQDAAAATTLRFGHVFAENSLENSAIKSFADAVRERTEGEIDIQIFPAGQLGDVGSTFQGLTLGTIDLSFVDISLLGYQKGHEEFFVGHVPYLFESQEWARKIYNSEIFQPLYDRIREQKGIRVLAVRGDRAPRSFNTTRGPIFNPEDVKDLKIRVTPHPVAIATFEAWGFKPTPINYNELYLALRQGVVEGQDNGLDVTVPAKFYEVTDYYAYSNHVYSVYGWYIAEKTWKRIPEEYHQILAEEAAKAGDMITARGQAREVHDLETILKAGLKVTIPNRPAFKELSKDVYKQFEGKLWPEGMVAKIKAMQESE